MDCEERLVEQARVIKAINAETKVYVYRNLVKVPETTARPTIVYHSMLLLLSRCVASCDFAGVAMVHKRQDKAHRSGVCGLVPQVQAGRVPG
jgi:hypothetical protein